MRSLVSALVAALVLAVAQPTAFATGPTDPTPAPTPVTPASPAPSGAQPGTGANTPRPGFASVGIQMVTAQGKPAAQTRYTYEGTPGARFPTDAFAVVNYGTQPLSVHVYANDAIDTATGGFDLKTAGTAPTDIGGWLHLDLKTPYVTVPPADGNGDPGRVVVTFHLQVPALATPGDHVGGIVAGVVSPATDDSGNRINVEQRVGLRVYLRVPGTLRAQMSVTKVSSVYHGTWNPFGTGSATVTYTVKNTGNVRLDAAQALRVTSLFGSTEWKSAPPGQGVIGTDISELLPGQQVTMTREMTGVVPAFASFARVSVDPRAMSGDQDPEAVGDARSAAMPTVPWPWVLLLLVLLLAFGWRTWRRRRAAGTGLPRRRKPLVYPSAPAAEAEANAADGAVADGAVADGAVADGAAADGAADRAGPHEGTATQADGDADAELVEAAP